LARAYTLLFSLLTGDLAPLHELQSRFHFVNVIGIPRTGSSYLTAELYRALGRVPARGINSWVVTLKTVAEYLAMV
jgi:hypothetical protein